MNFKLHNAASKKYCNTDQAALAAKHGAHVITEKPITTRWAQTVWVHSQSLR